MLNRVSRPLRACRALSLAVGLSLVTVAAAPVASAQSAAEVAKARTLFKEGLSLEAAGDWAGALQKFQDVAKVKTTPQVRYHIARCKEHLGRMNEALGEYRIAEYEAEQAKAKELPEITKAREELEGRIPKLTIRRGEGAESAKIQVDGVDFGETQIGKQVTIDPGSHKIVARIGSAEFEETVTLAEGESKEVELVPPEDFGKGAAKTKPIEKEPEPEPAPIVKVDEVGPGALPWIIGGVGLVSLGAGGYFLVQRNKAEDDLKTNCRDDVCPAAKQSVGDDGKRYALLTNVAFGVGVVGLGVATVWLLSSGGSEKKPEASALRFDVHGAPGTAGVNVAGKF